jgi:serine/threonine protein kinase
MIDNQDNTLGSGFVTDGGGADAGLGSGFVTNAPSANTQSSNASATFTDLKELSSQGAMSTVYQGKKYGKWHIIKRIKPQFKDNPQYRELFLKEFDNGIQLDHPNIVRIEDKGEDAEGLWYSMEYVDGRPLTQMIKSGELIKNPRLVRNILEQLCDALTYVHKKQIVHRDLKPDNVLVTYRGDNVKVLDFGLAYSDSYDDHLVKAGTPKYAAPEQMTKGNTVDQRADIYAVGLMLLEMTTGSLADRQATTVEDPNFQQIIIKATKQNPDERYHDCREIIDDLNRTIAKPAAVTSSPTPSPQPTVAQTTTSTPRPTEVQGERKKNMLPIFIIVGVLLIGGIVAWLLLGNKGGNGNNGNGGNGGNTANNDQKQEQPQQPDNQQNTVPDTKPEPVQPVVDDKTNNGPTEEEKQQNQEQSALKEEYEQLLADAKKVFDTKNVARALPLYEAIVNKTPAYAEAQNEAKAKVEFCKKQIAKTPLYSLKKEMENGNIGYLNKDGYIVVDFLYKDELRHKKGGKLLAVKDNLGKWGFIDEATKLPITDFKYTDIDNKHDYAGEYRMNVAGNNKRFDIIKADKIEEYTNGKKTNTILIRNNSSN